MLVEVEQQGASALCDGGLFFHLSGRASSHAPLHHDLSGVRAASTAYTNMLPVCLSLRSGQKYECRADDLKAEAEEPAWMPAD